jgi:hypothetical protein
MKTAEQIKTKAKVITEATIMQVVSLFLALKGTTFIQLWQKTTNISGMNKGKKNDGTKGVNRFYGKVYKLNCLNAVTNYNYENMVNKARSKEAMQELRQAMISAGVPIEKIEAFFKGAKKDITENAEQFKSAGLPFGKYVNESKCIIIDTPDINGKSQWAGVEGYYIQLAILNYAKPVYKWIETDTELTEAELTEMKQFIRPKTEGASQGLEKPYIIRSPRFETVQSVSLQGSNYRLVG